MPIRSPCDLGLITSRVMTHRAAPATKRKELGTPNGVPSSFGCGDGMIRARGYLLHGGEYAVIVPLLAFGDSARLTLHSRIKTEMT